MDIGSRILSDLVVYGKYAQHLYGLHRRESFEETAARNMEMHISRFPELKGMIQEAYDLVRDKKVLPSMRSMQFAGPAIAKNQARMYNCAFTPVDHHSVFAEVMFLLLCGTGVGYSVQHRHIRHLPSIKEPGPSIRYLVSDSIEGWADAVRHLMKAYLQGAPKPRFSFDDIRPKGADLSSGGKAPGPEPLAQALERSEEVLARKKPGEKLTPLECHDIICHIANAVLAGGIRRSAMMALFDPEDELMLTCKNPGIIDSQPQRYRSNNSAVLIRAATSREEFDRVWSMCADAQTGEPGIFWTNDPDMGTNPCCEIALRPNGFCNLTEINSSDVADQADLEERAWAASVIGTLQASYTDFHYLRPVWKWTAESDRLLGIGMTGIASGKVLELDLAAAARHAAATNAELARSLGIQPAARVTCVKPSGTTSLVLGCSSGIHAWHDSYYIRRVRLWKTEPLAQHLIKHHPELLEASEENPAEEVIVTVPVAAPDEAITRQESAMDLLQRVQKVTKEWILPGHRHGANRHNVSCTVTIKEDEWKEVGDWMWENRSDYTGLSCFPYWEGSYRQPPFEACNKDTYQTMASRLTQVDLKHVKEEMDRTNLEAELACSGGACEVKAV